MSARTFPSSAKRNGVSLVLARNWGNRILLLSAAATLLFLVVHLCVHGAAVRDLAVFQQGASWLFLLLCVTLSFSLLLDAVNAWREGFSRKELPPPREGPNVRERLFRTPESDPALVRHFVGQIDRHFRRFYAFHRYQAPYVVHYYYAKKGSLSLLSLPVVKTGFLLLFLFFCTSVARGGPAGLPPAVPGIGCLLVLLGMLIRAAYPYRKLWLRIVREGNRVSLSVSCSGRSKARWFEAFCDT